MRSRESEQEDFTRRASSSSNDGNEIKSHKDIVVAETGVASSEGTR